MSPIARLSGLLAQRTPREQRFVATAALVVAAAAALSLGDWLVHERERLATRLPHAHAEFARMQQDAADLRRLREAPPPAALPAAALLESARAAAASRGLGLSISAAGDTLQVRGEAEFGALVDWLAALHAELRLRPVRAQLEARGNRVAVEFDLAPGGER